MLLTDELIIALEPFFDWIGPTHDELDRVFERTGLAGFDPTVDGTQIGKRRRVREVLSAALSRDSRAGTDLVALLIELIRAKDGFTPGTEHCPGEREVEKLRGVLRRNGYDLSEEGELRALVLDGLSGRALTEALRTYVDRARWGAADAALLVGTSKELIEATAKHVLAENGLSWRPTTPFHKILESAFAALDLPSPMWDWHEKRAQLNGATEWDRMVQALSILGSAVNDFRNAQGTGHGRPSLPELNDLQSRIAAQSAAVVASLLLEMLSQHQTIDLHDKPNAGVAIE